MTDGQTVLVQAVGEPTAFLTVTVGSVRSWLLMAHTVFALIVTASLSLAAPNVWPFSQAPSTPTDDGKREFTISGCLLRSGYAGYQVEDARLDAIDGKSVTEPAPAPASEKSGTPKKWILEGGGNLSSRTGEKVQVVGRSDWKPLSASEAPADEPPNRTPHLDVKSVKTLASTCS